MRPVRVIGCGNPDAGDDAAGLVAAEEVARRAPDGVEVVLARDPLRLLDLLEGARRVIVVDAIRAPDGGRTPGAVIRAEAGPDGLPAAVRSSLSSHGLGIAETIGIAAAIGDAPPIVFHGVEAGNVRMGSAMSADVRAALPLLVERVLADARP
ncbi:MAG TPA: hydrogenase maturation protease [Actinomycetota bacterium]|nr:hydrogenase maturation protease [Actinomycetota bacterium]